MEFLTHDEKNIEVVGVLFREVGPGVSKKLFGTVAPKIRGTCASHAQRQWTQLLKARFREHGWLLDTTFKWDIQTPAPIVPKPSPKLPPWQPLSAPAPTVAAHHLSHNHFDQTTSLHPVSHELLNQGADKKRAKDTACDSEAPAKRAHTNTHPQPHPHPHPHTTPGSGLERGPGTFEQTGKSEGSPNFWSWLNSLLDAEKKRDALAAEQRPLADKKTLLLSSLPRHELVDTLQEKADLDAYTERRASFLNSLLDTEKKRASLDQEKGAFAEKQALFSNPLLDAEKRRQSTDEKALVEKRALFLNLLPPQRTDVEKEREALAAEKRRLFLTSLLETAKKREAEAVARGLGKTRALFEEDRERALAKKKTKGEALAAQKKRQVAVAEKRSLLFKLAAARYRG